MERRVDGGTGMCTAVYVNGVFDASRCPLLNGLSPEEQDRRLRTDPRIRSCMEALGGDAATDRATARLVATASRIGAVKSRKAQVDDVTAVPACHAPAA